MEDIGVVYVAIKEVTEIETKNKLKKKLMLNGFAVTANKRRNWSEIDSEAVIIRDKENIDFQTEVMPCREANKANWSHYSLPKDAAIQSRYSTNF